MVHHVCKVTALMNGKMKAEIKIILLFISISVCVIDGSREHDVFQGQLPHDIGYPRGPSEHLTKKMDKCETCKDITGVRLLITMKRGRKNKRCRKKTQKWLKELLRNMNVEFRVEKESPKHKHHQRKSNNRNLHGHYVNLNKFGIQVLKNGLKYHNSAFRFLQNRKKCIRKMSSCLEFNRNVKSCLAKLERQNLIQRRHRLKQRHHNRSYDVHSHNRNDDMHPYGLNLVSYPRDHSLLIPSHYETKEINSYDKSQATHSHFQPQEKHRGNAILDVQSHDKSSKVNPGNDVDGNSNNEKRKGKNIHTDVAQHSSDTKSPVYAHMKNMFSNHNAALNINAIDLHNPSLNMKSHLQNQVIRGNQERFLGSKNKAIHMQDESLEHGHHTEVADHDRKSQGRHQELDKIRESVKNVHASVHDIRRLDDNKKVHRREQSKASQSHVRSNPHRMNIHNFDTGSEHHSKVVHSNYESKLIQLLNKNNHVHPYSRGLSYYQSHKNGVSTSTHGAKHKHGSHGVTHGAKNKHGSHGVTHGAKHKHRSHRVTHGAKHKHRSHRVTHGAKHKQHSHRVATQTHKTSKVIHHKKRTLGNPYDQRKIFHDKSLYIHSDDRNHVSNAHELQGESSTRHSKQKSSLTSMYNNLSVNHKRQKVSPSERNMYLSRIDNHSNAVHGKSEVILSKEGNHLSNQYGRSKGDHVQKSGIDSKKSSYHTNLYDQSQGVHRHSLSVHLQDNAHLSYSHDENQEDHVQKSDIDSEGKSDHNNLYHRSQGFHRHIPSVHFQENEQNSDSHDQSQEDHLQKSGVDLAGRGYHTNLDDRSHGVHRQSLSGHSQNIGHLSNSHDQSHAIPRHSPIVQRRENGHKTTLHTALFDKEGYGKSMNFHTSINSDVKGTKDYDGGVDYSDTLHKRGVQIVQHGIVYHKKFYRFVEDRVHVINYITLCVGGYDNVHDCLAQAERKNMIGKSRNYLKVNNEEVLLKQHTDTTGRKHRTSHTIEVGTIFKRFHELGVDLIGHGILYKETYYKLLCKDTTLYTALHACVQLSGDMKECLADLAKEKMIGKGQEFVKYGRGYGLGVKFVKEGLVLDAKLIYDIWITREEFIQYLTTCEDEYNDVKECIKLLQNQNILGAARPYEVPVKVLRTHVSNQTTVTHQVKIVGQEFAYEGKLYVLTCLKPIFVKEWKSCMNEYKDMGDCMRILHKFYKEKQVTTYHGTGKDIAMGNLFDRFHALGVKLIGLGLEYHGYYYRTNGHCETIYQALRACHAHTIDISTCLSELHKKNMLSDGSFFTEYGDIYRLGINFAKHGIIQNHKFYGFLADKKTFIEYMTVCMDSYNDASKCVNQLRKQAILGSAHDDTVPTTVVDSYITMTTTIYFELQISGGKFVYKNHNYELKCSLEHFSELWKDCINKNHRLDVCMKKLKSLYRREPSS